MSTHTTLSSGPARARHNGVFYADTMADAAALVSAIKNATPSRVHSQSLTKCVQLVLAHNTKADGRGSRFDWHISNGGKTLYQWHARNAGE